MMNDNLVVSLRCYVVYMWVNKKCYRGLCGSGGCMEPLPVVASGGVPRNFVQGGGGGSTNSVEGRGQRTGTWGR